jgi:hypothetical protein
MRRELENIGNWGLSLRILQLMKKSVFILLLQLCFGILACAQHPGMGHRSEVTINVDSVCSMTKSGFDSLIGKSLQLMKTNSFAELSDRERAVLIRLDNTYLMGTDADRLALKRFAQVLDEKKYFVDLLKIYPDCVISRGMGYYIPKLQIESLGTPHYRSYYTVKR